VGHYGQSAKIDHDLQRALRWSTFALWGQILAILIPIVVFVAVLAVLPMIVL